MKLFLPLLFLLFPAASLLPAQPPVLIDQPAFQTTARAAIDSLYNRNPVAAGELMEPWSRRYPDHPVWELWKGMELWWVLLNDLHDESRDEEFFQQMQRADDEAVQVLKQQEDHTDALIVRAVANGYIARHHSNRQRWVRSIQAARVALQAHSALTRFRPDLEEVYFAEGLKLYYSEYLPEAYTLVRAVSWLLPSGDKQEGLKLLEISSREAVFARPEANYFLGNILLNYEKDYGKALSYFRKLTDLYPDNGYYRRLLVRTLYRRQLDRQAEAEIDQALRHWQEKGFTDREVLKEELLYWKGRTLMRRGDHRAAYEAFREGYRAGRDLPQHEKRSFHVLAGYYAGVTSEWNGETDRARNYYRDVIALEGEPEARERAKKRLAEL